MSTAAPAARAPSGARRTRLILAGLVAVALAFRLALLAAEPRPFDSSGLVLNHAELARNAVDHGRWFEVNLRAFDVVGKEQAARLQLVDPSSVDFSAADAHPRYQKVVLQPVGEGVVLAGLWWLTGDERYLYIQLLQIALDALMVLLVFSIARRLYRRDRAALIAAGLYAVFLPIARITRIPHLDIWAVYATLIVAWLMVRARDSERPVRWLLAAGLATGIGLYFRPGVLLIPVAMALAAIAWIGWRRALAAAAIPVVVAALLAVPWTIRNFNDFDRFIPTRIGIGQNLWEGLGEVQNDFGATLDDQVTAAQVKQEDPKLVYGTPQYDDHLKTKAEDAIRDHPGHFAKVVARRAVLTTVGLRNLDFPLEPILFVLAVGVAIITRRRFAQQHLLLAAIPIATALPYLVLHVEPRYMLPASFVYLIWVALGADLLLERRRRPAPA